MRRVRTATWSAWAVVATLLVTTATHVWWLEHFRRGGPTYTDEAGEFASAAENTAALQHGGLRALWHAFQGRAPRAPLLSLLGVPFNLVLGRGMSAGFAELLVFLALLVAGTYFLARRITTRPFAALAAVVVATSPGVAMWYRAYFTVAPSLALFVAGVACLLWSDGLRRVGPAVAAGGLFGLTLLARAMTIGMVPCAFLGGAVLLVGGGDRLRRLTTLVLTGAATVAVAATWYLHNSRLVLDHLSQDQSDARDPLAGVEQVWHLLLTLVIVTCLVLGAVWAIKRRARREVDPRARDAGALAVMAVAMAVVLGIAHKTVGEWLPLACLIAVLAIAIVPALPWQRLQNPLTGALLVAAAVNHLASADVVSTVSRRRSIDIGTWSLTVTDGRDFVHVRADGHQYPRWNPAERPPPEIRAWPPFVHEVTVFVADHARQQGFVPTVVFAGARRLLFFNAWSVAMDDRFTVHSGMYTGALDVRGEPDGLAAYRLRLHDPRFGWPNIFIVPDDNPGFPNEVPQATADRAAEQEGFTLVRTFLMPDGRTARVWWYPRGNPSAGGTRAYLTP